MDRHVTRLFNVAEGPYSGEYRLLANKILGLGSVSVGFDNIRHVFFRLITSQCCSWNRAIKSVKLKLVCIFWLHSALIPGSKCLNGVAEWSKARNVNPRFPSLTLPGSKSFLHD